MHAPQAVWLIPTPRAVSRISQRVLPALLQISAEKMNRIVAGKYFLGLRLPKRLLLQLAIHMVRHHPPMNVHNVIPKSLFQGPDYNIDDPQKQGIPPTPVG